MQKLLLIPAAGLILLAGMKVTDSTADRLHQSADLLLESLDAQQRADAVLPFADPQRTGWHFIPKDDRKGLAISEMNESQRVMALRLVRAALSEIGYRKVDQIRQLESVVAQLEGPDRRWARDSDAYWLTLFGEPGDEGSWGMSFEGHHVSINLVCRDGEVVDSTPQFFGTHPATVPEPSGPDQTFATILPTGTRVLAAEEDVAFELIRSLSSSSLKRAMIADEAPAETRFAGEPQADVPDQGEGIGYGELTPPQKALLQRLVHLYTDAAADSIARSRRSRIEADGWDAVRFAWAGSTQPGVGHYYKVRGPSFLIEFVNSQPDAMGNPANHAHCVLRDLTGDFDLER